MCFCDSDPSCSIHTTNSGEWLQKNLGGFSVLVSFHDLQMLYSNFSAVLPVALCLLLLCLYICLLLLFFFFVYVLVHLSVCVHMQMAALPHLTVRQLAEVSATPGQLTSPTQVTMVMKHIPNQLLPTFFDDFSPAITVSVRRTPIFR